MKKKKDQIEHRLLLMELQMIINDLSTSSTGDFTIQVFQEPVYFHTVSGL